VASSIVHEVAQQFNNLACSCGLMFDWAISTIAFRSLFSSIWLSKRTELYWIITEQNNCTEQNYTELYWTVL